MADKFEYAVRNKLRFPYKGKISVEDLWDLSETQLDQVYKELKKQEQHLKEDSLLSRKTKEEEILEIQIEIVKYIVVVKLAEKEAMKKAAENKEKKQKILAVLAARDDKALEQASDEELKRMLEELGE
ncbi:MAG: hypothetical protein HFI75_09220 [Lachnospiraceae bacterium]|nr:hypothetical protein [Lachnospiraceae bacterium]